MQEIELHSNEPSDSFRASEAHSQLGKPESQLPRTIGVEHLRPRPMAAGETEIVWQRHGAYIRRAGEHAGSLQPEARDEQSLIGYHFMNDLLDGIPPVEQQGVDVLYLASDTQYGEGGRRSYETAVAAQAGVRRALDEHGLDGSQVINERQPTRGLKGELQTGGPRVEGALREPQMLDSEDFRRFLADEYGDLTPQFWQAFEEDTHAETRRTLGAEGPDDIADRALKFTDILRRYAARYHQEYPNRRLVIWATTHYDVISPLVKLKLWQGNKEDIVGVDYGGGIVMKIDRSGRTTSLIGAQEYEVPSFRASEE